jgi:transcriptional regulator with AAA-type ATPase domain
MDLQVIISRNSKFRGNIRELQEKIDEIAIYSQ